MKLSLILLVAILVGCAEPPKYLYSTCRMEVERVDAMGVKHTDCIYQTIP